MQAVVAADGTRRELAINVVFQRDIRWKEKTGRRAHRERARPHCSVASVPACQCSLPRLTHVCAFSSPHLQSSRRMLRAETLSRQIACLRVSRSRAGVTTAAAAALLGRRNPRPPGACSGAWQSVRMQREVGMSPAVRAPPGALPAQHLVSSTRVATVVATRRVHLGFWMGAARAPMSRIRRLQPP